jgi:hypothetical protein
MHLLGKVEGALAVSVLGVGVGPAPQQELHAVQLPASNGQMQRSVPGRRGNVHALRSGRVLHQKVDYVQRAAVLLLDCQVQRGFFVRLFPGGRNEHGLIDSNKRQETKRSVTKVLSYSLLCTQNNVHLIRSLSKKKMLLTNINLRKNYSLRSKL